MADAQSIEAPLARTPGSWKARRSCRTCRNGFSIHRCRRLNAGASSTISSRPSRPCSIRKSLAISTSSDLIYKVDIGDDRLVKIDMTLTAPGCPVASELTRSIETAVGAVAGVLGVNVAVVFDPPWDQGRMSDEARVSLDMF